MTKTSAEVEREVEATRGQIDQTVEALKEKMQPRELFDEATRIMGSASNKTLTMVVEQARANPIPLALIGAGVAWLVFEQTRKGRTDIYATDRPYETYEGYQEDGGIGGKIKARVGGAVEAAKGALTGAKDRAAGAVASAKDSLAGARTSAADGAGAAKGRIGALTDTARTRATEVGRRAQQRYQETLDAEPLIIGALGLAVGVAIGAALPSTQVERRYIGPTRDKFLDRGKEAAKASLSEVRTVAERAYGEVKGELHRQTGPEGEGSTLTEKAQALADAGRTAVKEELDTRLPH